MWLLNVGTESGLTRDSSPSLFRIAAAVSTSGWVAVGIGRYFTDLEIISDVRFKCDFRMVTSFWFWNQKARWFHCLVHMSQNQGFQSKTLGFLRQPNLRHKSNSVYTTRNQLYFQLSNSKEIYRDHPIYTQGVVGCLNCHLCHRCLALLICL